MIDVKVTVLGGPEIADKLAQADSGIRQELRAELAEVGQEIVDGARSRAPHRTGGLQNRIIWYFGQEMMRGPKGGKHLTPVDTKWKDGRIRLTVRPTGRVAHLMERGVNASFDQRLGNRKRIFGPQAAGKAEIQGPGWRYPRTLVIRPRPFFMPAVQAAGGSEGINARLQARLDRLADSLGQGKAA